MRIRLALAAIAIGLHAVAPALAAEMGSAPASSGLFMAVDGGYLDLEQDDILGHAINRAGTIGAPVEDTRLSPDIGWSAGLSAGWRSGAPFVTFLPFNRWEAYLSYAEGNAALHDSVSGAGTIDLHNADTSTIASIGGTGQTEVERRTWELGTRSAVDTGTPGSSSLTWVLQSFTRLSDEETATLATGTADAAIRTSEVETRSYGLMALVEPELWLGPSIAIVGRAGAGLYGYDIDGDFLSYSTARPDSFGSSVSDDADGLGFRGQLGAGIKLQLDDAAMLTGFAEADYLSDVGMAVLPSAALSVTSPASVATDDAWEVRVGARLSIRLLGSP